MNTNLSDVANAITLSLATTGVSQMTGPILAASGNVGAPSYAFASDQATGFYLAGTHQIGIATNGNLLATFNSDQTVNWTNTQTAPAFISSGGGVIMPVGTISFFAGTTAPSGWQLCAGQAISRTTYAALFAVVGTTYGIGDGSTTFTLPDCRGRGLFGKDNMGGGSAGRISAGGGNFDGTVLGNVGGLQNHTMTTNELVAHSHSASSSSSDSGHTHGFPGGANVPTFTGGASVASGPASVTAISGTATGFANISTSTTVFSTGSTNPFTVMNPSIIFNVIIFSAVP